MAHVLQVPAVLPKLHTQFVVRQVVLARVAVQVVLLHAATQKSPLVLPPAQDLTEHWRQPAAVQAAGVALAPHPTAVQTA